MQGYFPEGHVTPFSPVQDFRKDLDLLKTMGFNGLRMHQKAEDPRFYALCDALGLVCWAEMPSAYLPCEHQRTLVHEEWQALVHRDHTHPSIITWVPVNESWGAPLVAVDGDQRSFVEDLYHLTKQWDSTRLVIDNSGFDHTVTDVLDFHHYLISPSLARDFYRRLLHPENLLFSAKDQLFKALALFGVTSAYTPGYAWRGEPMVISEYGGFGFYPVTPLLRSTIEAFDAYTIDIAKTGFLRGYCYTQLYDTFQEANGLLDFHRQPKAPVSAVAAVNQRALNTYRRLNPIRN